MHRKFSSFSFKWTKKALPEQFQVDHVPFLNFLKAKDENSLCFQVFQICFKICFRHLVLSDMII